MIITVGILKDICASLEREYGSDSNVFLKVYDHETDMSLQSVCISTEVSKDGELILTNKRSESSG